MSGLKKLVGEIHRRSLWQDTSGHGRAAGVGAAVLDRAAAGRFPDRHGDGLRGRSADGSRARRRAEPRAFQPPLYLAEREKEKLTVG